MTKVFLIGEAPLPYHKSAKRPAAGLRTWQFMKPLIDNGHETLALLFTRPDFWLDGRIPETEESIVYIDRDDGKWSGLAQEIIREFKPDVVVGVNSLACERVTELKFDVPFWADINGSPTMEAEAQAWRIGSDGLLPHFWAREKKILNWADFISTCSERQKMTTFGMLAGLGRLNHYTFGQELIHAIPNLTEFWPEVDNVPVQNKPLLRGHEVPASAIVVGMVGGWWNSWLDEETLFRGLEGAITENDRIHFVAGGGAVPGLTLAPLDNFRALVSNSPLQKHFHFLGWLPTSRLAQVYHETDIAINIDRDCADTRTGARNRLTEWTKFGLPIITTRGTEVSEKLIHNRAAVPVKIGDHRGLSEALCWLAGKPTLRRQIGQAGQKYCRHHWNYETGMRGFIKWIENPVPAFDHNYYISMKTGFWNTKIRAGWTYIRENGWRRGINKIRQSLFSKI